MNGPHPKKCQCRSCVDMRFSSFVDRIKSFRKETGAAPASPLQTVFVKEYRVRPHFRRNPHHLQGDPALKERVEGYFQRFAPKKPVGG